MEVVISGILFGLLLSVMIGPVFFSLIQSSVEKGFFAGAIMSLGILFSDAFYVWLTNFSLRSLFSHPRFSFYLGFIGGVIMLAFGVYNFFKPLAKKGIKQVRLSKSLALNQFLKGVSLNGINPFVLLFWVGMVSFVSIDRGFDQEQKFIFFTSLLSTVFITDIGKSYLAHKLRSLVTNRLILILNKIVGIALFMFGVRLLWFAYGNYVKVDSTSLNLSI